MTDAAKEKQELVNKASEEINILMASLQEKQKNCDKEQKDIAERKELIAVEAEQVEALRLEAQTALETAMPACEAAKEAVSNLDSKSINEIKAYTTPPKAVTRVMGAVMTYFGEATDWASIKKTLMDSGFIKRVLDLDMENLKKPTMEKIAAYTSKEDFTVKDMTKISAMAGILTQWVRSVEEFYKAYQIVKPKKEKVAKLEAELAEKYAVITALEAKLAELLKEKEQLEKDYNEAKKNFDMNQRELEQLKSKIDRGERLINGLSDEKVRWEKSLEDYKIEFFELTGDSILAAAYMSYCGPFPANFRQQLHTQWVRKIHELQLPYKKKFTFINF